MATVKRCIHLMSYLRMKGLRDAYPLAAGATANLYAEGNLTAEEIVEKLSGNEYYKAFLVEDLPAEYHYNNFYRSGAVVLIANEGTYFREQGGEENPITGPKNPGMHGFPPEDPDMHGVFYAWGRNVRKGARTRAVRIIDVYPTVCDLLHLDPAPPTEGEFIGELFERGRRAE